MKEDIEYLCTQDIAEYYGVHEQTIRRWERLGKLLPHHRTIGNHRRYEQPKVEGLTVGYVRVSSTDQKNDLEVQSKALEVKAKGKGITLDTVIKDIGSGMNYKKKGFVQLMGMIMTNKVKEIVIMHKDRLLRFGAEIVILLCKSKGVKVTILEENAAKTVTEQLCLDLVEIMTVFVNKLYGHRSKTNLSSISPKKASPST